MAKVINLYGGPAVGKTTSAASVFSHLKAKGYKVGLVQEFATELIMANRITELKNQVYIMGEMYTKIKILDEKMDFVVTDSPLLLNLVYAKYQKLDIIDKGFEQLTKYLYTTFDNIDILMSRDDSFYTPFGRTHTLDESKIIDNMITNMLNDMNIEYEKANVNNIIEIIDNKIFK